MSQEETIEILEELLNSVKSRGYKKTLTVLKTERLKKSMLMKMHLQLTEQQMGCSIK
jgi:hypothetical protein